MKRRLFWLSSVTAILLLGFSQPCFSAGIGLKLPTTARIYALSEAQLASIKSPAEALYSNPAGLLNIENPTASFLYYDGLLDVSYTYISYAQEINLADTKIGAGVGLGMLDAGKATIYELDDSERNISAMKDTYLTVGLGKRLTTELSAGLSLKLIDSKLAEDYKAGGLAIDLATLYQGKLFSLAGSLQNIGSGLKYEEERSKLPTNLKIGIALKHPTLPVEFMMATNKERDKSNKISLGAEYLLLPYFTVRAGYKTGFDNQGLSLGIGIIHKSIEFDYAFVPIKDLDSEHRVSILIYGIQ